MLLLEDVTEKYVCRKLGMCRFVLDGAPRSDVSEILVVNMIINVFFLEISRTSENVIVENIDSAPRTTLV